MSKNADQKKWHAAIQAVYHAGKSPTLESSQEVRKGIARLQLIHDRMVGDVVIAAIWEHGFDPFIDPDFVHKVIAESVPASGVLQ